MKTSTYTNYLPRVDRCNKNKQGLLENVCSDMKPLDNNLPANGFHLLHLSAEGNNAHEWGELSHN